MLMMVPIWKERWLESYLLTTVIDFKTERNAVQSSAKALVADTAHECEDNRLADATCDIYIKPFESH